ncbi:phospholipase D-like domain-containing protein [Bdellovibrionota bacterium FG-2]
MKILILSILSVVLCLSCSSLRPASSAHALSTGSGEALIAQSIPLKTDLANPSFPMAKDVWVQMIKEAQVTIDIAQFYVTNQADSALELTIQELEKAGSRGIKIRFLIDSVMLSQDPLSLERLKKIPGLTFRVLNLKKITGGILHAKYWIIDGKRIFIGSQNFDWRALEHIHEMGALVESLALAFQLTQIFEADWEMALTGKAPIFPNKPLCAPAPNDIELVASPPQFNPPGTRSAIDALIPLIQGAKKQIQIQLLSYSTKEKTDKWLVIDQALRDAQARGVQVQLLVADWSITGTSGEALKALVKDGGIDVRFAKIPTYSTGPIPYARVIHSKVMIVDHETLWLGTSNWSHGYFADSRNVELIFKGQQGLTYAPQMEMSFNKLWNGAYVEKIDPSKEYPSAFKN